MRADHPSAALLWFRFSEEGHAECIANEEGERQIACAISYNGEEVVSLAISSSSRAAYIEGGRVELDRPSPTSSLATSRRRTLTARRICPCV